MINVLVTGAGGAAGVAVIRSLIRNVEFFVVASDCDPHAAGLQLADDAVVLPNASDAQYPARLREVCRRHRIQALIVTVAEEMPTIARMQAELHAIGSEVLLPDLGAFTLCNDKLKFSKHLQAHSIATPETQSISSAVPSVEGPWIIKPRSGRGSRDVYYADSADDIRYARERIADPILQHRIDGREFSVDVLVDRDGTIAGHSARWRLATKGGISTSGLTFEDNAVTALTQRVMHSLRYRGMACLQGFLTESGDAICIEVNPRFGGGVSLSVAAGADFACEFVHTTMGFPARPDRLRAIPGTRMTRYFDEVYELVAERVS